MEKDKKLMNRMIELYLSHTLILPDDNGDKSNEPACEFFKTNDRDRVIAIGCKIRNEACLHRDFTLRV